MYVGSKYVVQTANTCLYAVSYTHLDVYKRQHNVYDNEAGTVIIIIGTRR